MAVTNLLDSMDVQFEKVELGEVCFETEPEQSFLRDFEAKLVDMGFSLSKSREAMWVEKVKLELITLLEGDKVYGEVSLSSLLSQKTGLPYSRLSNLFSREQGLSIEQYFIGLKIEKAKEWMSYGSMNISEIAWSLGYSSVQHFSSQFKKVAGITPSHFKSLNQKPRRSLDQVGKAKLC
ncbi:Helix-turn-helix domain-containing protein [Cyclobacterium lianum]|uniref:Helix-turn-helix domain-containing protein n=1 Tax=Cyclobacterium lianum TaxID=388280 RepID=A0A1M7NI77_9BACT|nr:AraC family transcriptional regulator [Cyclobacterium lianum]SHN03501.1 Helix-turn-helix domain-containing protein [Cyclobacterium lianum]